MKYPPIISNGDIAEAIRASLQSNFKHIMQDIIVPKMASAKAENVSVERPFKL